METSRQRNSMAKVGRLREQSLHQEVDVSQQSWCLERKEGGGAILDRKLGCDKTHILKGVLGFYTEGSGALNLHLVSLSLNSAQT